MTKQPSLGTALSLLHMDREGPRKGALNNAHLQTTPGGIFSSGRTTAKNSGSTPAPKGVTGLKLACCNIMTMLNSADSNRPQRRSALVAHELSHLNIDIAALSEVRFLDTGSLKEHGTYTLYWSGKPQSKRRLSGVGFMIKNCIASKLENFPTGHSDRVISMRLPLRKKQYVTVFSVYSPDFSSGCCRKDEKFYTDLRNLVRNTPQMTRSFRVGQDSDAWKRVVGKHGVGNSNDNGRLLLEFCAELQLTITNTILQQKDSLKTTWMHPWSKHWHLIDYILVR